MASLYNTLNEFHGTFEGSFYDITQMKRADDGTILGFTGTSYEGYFEAEDKTRFGELHANYEVFVCYSVKDVVQTGPNLDGMFVGSMLSATELEAMNCSKWNSDETKMVYYECAQCDGMFGCYNNKWVWSTEDLEEIRDAEAPCEFAMDSDDERKVPFNDFMADSLIDGILPANAIEDDVDEKLYYDSDYREPDSDYDSDYYDYDYHKPDSDYDSDYDVDADIANAIEDDVDELPPPQG